MIEVEAHYLGKTATMRIISQKDIVAVTADSLLRLTTPHGSLPIIRVWLKPSSIVWDTIKKIIYKISGIQRYPDNFFPINAYIRNEQFIIVSLRGACLPKICLVAYCFCVKLKTRIELMTPASF